MKVLITSGATREPIDRVRFISNISTGGTGAVIADEFARNGIDTTLLLGVGAKRPDRMSEVRVQEYESFLDLDSKLQTLLRNELFDAVIHAAAVSDYSVAHPYSGKIDSDLDEMKVILKRNFKIVERLKDYSQDRGLTRVVAFKLTDNPAFAQQLQAVQKLSMNPAVDYVVHNDLSQITPEGRPDSHHFSIFRQDRMISETDTKLGLAELLIKLLRGSGVAKER